MKMLGTALLALVLLVAVGCEETPLPPSHPPIGGGGGGSPTPVESRFSWPSTDPQQSPRPRRFSQTGGWMYRAGKAITAAEAAEAGWTIDPSAGLATYQTAQFGMEIIRWRVPPLELTPDLEDGIELWLSGQATSPSHTNLALLIGLGTTGTWNDKYIEKGSMSTGGKPADTEEINIQLMPNWNAPLNSEAKVKINLGWQSSGIEVIYSYRYL